MNHARRQQYRRLFEQNPIPMWVYDPETLRFLEVNEAAVRHYGYSRQEFLGMTLLDIRPAEDAQRLIEAMGFYHPVPTLISISLLLAAFLTGSLPNGFLIARAKGVDIRKHGSGNIGATNVWRVCGRKTPALDSWNYCSAPLATPPRAPASSFLATASPTAKCSLSTARAPSRRRYSRSVSATRKGLPMCASPSSARRSSLSAAVNSRSI